MDFTIKILTSIVPLQKQIELIQMKDRRKLTPLHIAFSLRTPYICEEDLTRLILVLLNMKADPTCKDGAQKRPLDYVAPEFKTNVCIHLVTMN